MIKKYGFTRWKVSLSAIGCSSCRLNRSLFLLCSNPLCLLSSFGSRRSCLTWLSSRLPLMRLHQRICKVIRLRSHCESDKSSSDEEWSSSCLSPILNLLKCTMGSLVILPVSQAASIFGVACRCSRVRLSSLVRGAGLLLDPVAAMTMGPAAVGSLAPFSQNVWVWFCDFNQGQ
jgi:hypothetical protein